MKKGDMKSIDGGNLIILKKVESRYDNCQHNSILVDAKLAKVECAQCGKELNPMWVLNRMVIQESRWNRERKNYIEMQEKLEKRVRTKCEHCKKMTRIRGF